jgi:hypothetical protein
VLERHESRFPDEPGECFRRVVRDPQGRAEGLVGESVPESLLEEMTQGEVGAVRDLHEKDAARGETGKDRAQRAHGIGQVLERVGEGHDVPGFSTEVHLVEPSAEDSKPERFLREVGHSRARLDSRPLEVSGASSGQEEAVGAAHVEEPAPGRVLGDHVQIGAIVPRPVVEALAGDERLPEGEEPREIHVEEQALGDMMTPRRVEESAGGASTNDDAVRELLHRLVARAVPHRTQGCETRGERTAAVMPGREPST